VFFACSRRGAMSFARVKGVGCLLHDSPKNRQLTNSNYESNKVELV